MTRRSNRADSTGNDNPICSADEDRYGFQVIAESLSRSILALDDGISTVIGIEGQWGAGKTSLLNLLLSRLKGDCPPGTYILQISPWLSPSSSGSVEGLLLPVAAILDEVKEKQYGWFRRQIRRCTNSRTSELAANVIHYAQQASGRLAPLAELAGNWIPGAGVAATAMKAVSAADLSARRQTTSALRAEIERNISELNLNFIVVLDDLDRLEPAQAVEVLRLVRSVADFSRFRYVMCYDPAVLSRAIEKGLGIDEGRRYLQKIVPLSFSLPRPEAFDLRREFREGALTYYRMQHGYSLNEAAITDLAHAVDIYGQRLTTPREVALALSAVRFRYPDMHDYVYFPDLCLLQLLRVVHPGLYDWIEQYLSERSVVESGDGTLSGTEINLLGERLRKILEEFTGRSGDPWELGRWVPGVRGDREKWVHLFETVSEQMKDEAAAQRRLSSSGFWRYYFSFSAPQNVLPESEIRLILHLAAADKEALSRKLLDSVTANGISSRTWFEHIIARLTPAVTAAASHETRVGLLCFFFDNCDELSIRFWQRSMLFRLQETGVDILVTDIIGQLMAGDRQDTLNMLSTLLRTGRAQWWIASFMRHQMWEHGLAGSRAAPESERLFAPEEIEPLREITAAHMAEQSGNLMSRSPEGTLLGYLYAWRDIAGIETVRHWLAEISVDDKSWLDLHLCLRTRVVSTDRGVFLRLNTGDIQALFGEEDIDARLRHIEETGQYPELCTDLRESIELNQFY